MDGKDRKTAGGKASVRKWFYIVPLIAVAAVAVYAAFGSGAGDEGNSEIIYSKVERGPLVINITESGSIKARDQMIIKSEVEGRPSILYLVPEGTRVQKGQLLVELDSSDLSDKRVNQDIIVQNAESSFISAKETLVITQNQAQSDNELAELKWVFSKEDLEKYREGEYPNQLNEAKGSVTLAQEELERAREKYEWSKKLFEESYLSETELRSDELSWKRSELSLKTAQSNLDLLERYTYKRQIAQLESDVRQNEMAFERTKRKSNSNIVQTEAGLRAKELEYKRQKEVLDKYVEQIAKAKIVAPEAGLVIYATSTQNRRWNQEPLAEGQEVYERQELIYLPLGDTFIAGVDIHESNLKKIYVGLPARIRVDALPGIVLNGVISKISPLPDAQKMWSNPDLKVYKTQIDIDGGGDVLKSGMNCQAEIIVEQHADAVYVPVQAVVRVEKKPAVWVKGARGPEMRHVETGMDNNRFVHVLSGLEPGEDVMLTPPLSGSVADDAQRILEEVNIPTKEEAQKQAEERNGAAMAAREKAANGDVSGGEASVRPPRQQGEGRRRGGGGAQSAAQ